MKNQRVKHILPIGHSQDNLTVVSEVYSVRKSTLSTQRCVDCLCECGNTAQVSVSRLASGKANCHYCGKPPNKSHRKCDTFLYNGLDRVDNSIGYIASNVVPCCYICNKMKGELPVEVFLEHLNNIFTRVG